MQIVRAFAAIPLPDEYQQMLKAIRAEWRDRLTSRVSWTKPGNWHVTVKFLGDVKESDLQGVIAALDEIPFTPFTLQAGGGGYFPPRGNPRVGWLGLKQGAATLTNLARETEAALLPLGFKKERRPFRPHLTLARIRRAEKDPWAELIEKTGSMPWPEVRIDSFRLYRSILNPGGARYETIAEFGATSL